MKKLFILAAVAASFTACSFDKDLGESASPTAVAEKVPLTVATTIGNISGVTSTTRANTMDYQSNSLLANVGLFVFKKNSYSVTETYEHNNVQCQTPSVVGSSIYYSFGTIGTSLFYPDSKSDELDLYAYAPYISNTATADATISNIPDTWTNIETTDKITFFTEQDQTADANYLKSDVLWGCAGTGDKIVTAADKASEGEGHSNGPYELLKDGGDNKANNNAITANAWQNAKAAYNSTALESGAYYVTSATEAKVRIPMLHRGSKIIIRVKTVATEMAYDKLSGATVQLKVDYLKGKLNLTSGALAHDGDASATYVTLTSNLSTAYSEESTQVGYQCCAVVIPQTTTAATAASQQFKITLSDNSTVYAWTPDSAPTFDSGKVYTYTITVKPTGLSVDASVSNWVDGSSGTGNAELQTTT